MFLQSFFFKFSKAISISPSWINLGENWFGYIWRRSNKATLFLISESLMFEVNEAKRLAGCRSDHYIYEGHKLHKKQEMAFQLSNFSHSFLFTAFRIKTDKVLF